MTSFVMPIFYCPFPSQINPQVEVVDRATNDWVRRYGLVHHEAAFARFRAAKYVWLSARAFPRTGATELAIVAQWNIWLFLLDDQSDESSIGAEPDRMQSLFAALLPILDGAPVGTDASPIAASLHDLWQRMRQRSTPAWQQRFRQTVSEYFTACVWEARNRAQQTIPSVADYIAMRQITGALLTNVDIIDLTEHIDLPSAVRTSAEVQRLTQMANNVVCWTNDIISLEKERQRGDFHNLVMVLQHAEHLSLQEAVDRANAMQEAEARGFLALEQRLPSYGPVVDRDLQRYLAVLRAWMRANLDWGRDSGRYRNVILHEEAIPYLEQILEGN